MEGLQLKPQKYIIYILGRRKHYLNDVAVNEKSLKILAQSELIYIKDKFHLKIEYRHENSNTWDLI